MSRSIRKIISVPGFRGQIWGGRGIGQGEDECKEYYEEEEDGGVGKGSLRE